ncbi:chemotaxis response regulator protein-glutamate methylesterase [uncultured Jannaschia sp.]|uniref:protein-glutamate methylesterase/protein-glutamine glutaminase n=1 Tax=uncultured Jannaschia sp. TaxID=293347 RepID=UPI002616F0A2|nr:chemotaxis response regulator protein-glutamate methylesterase [uncultured Jannaschia sp.]
MRNIRVLVVDGSPVMCAVLRTELERDPHTSVVGIASTAGAAREAIKALDPDVLTFDLWMPGMDGPGFLAKLMRLRPMPVVVVSARVGRGRTATSVQALALGAYDVFIKPEDGSLPQAYDPLRELVRGAAKTRLLPRDVPAAPAAAPDFAPDGRIVAIGASTGGVDALLAVLSGFPANCPPTVVTQHMPAAFTASFASRLDAHCAADVREATNGAPLKPGRIYLAPGGSRHLEVMGRDRRVCRLREGRPVNGHRPSVDVLFHSLARLGAPALGVILTGMGDDGARGLAAMRAAGARTLGQDEATSLVYGMPRVAHEMGAVEKQLPLSRMTRAVLERCNARSKPSRAA